MAFLSSVFNLPEASLSILFEKIDVNSDGKLSWDEYVSYLLREVAHNWNIRLARGTFHITNDQHPSYKFNFKKGKKGKFMLKQIIVIPENKTHYSPGQFCVCMDAAEL